MSLEDEVRLTGEPEAGALEMRQHCLRVGWPIAVCARFIPRFRRWSRRWSGSRGRLRMRQSYEIGVIENEDEGHRGEIKNAPASCVKNELHPRSAQESTPQVEANVSVPQALSHGSPCVGANAVRAMMSSREERQHA